MKSGHDISILGAGESGAGAAILAKRKGLKPWISDAGKIRDKYRQLIEQEGISYEEGMHSDDRILRSELIIKSPGIPDNIPILMAARKKGIPVISEIEFASRYTNARLICITGSNGKTTTTLLTCHLLKGAGLNVEAAGNVGESFAMKVATVEPDYYVLEISSFQLDGMFRFKADIAVLMNITPDHLDRYNNDFGAYIRSKFRIIQNQGGGDHFIFCADDPVIRKEMASLDIASKKYPFSALEEITGDGAFLSDKNLIININQNKFNMTLEELALQGRHNLYNSMAAGIAARILDIRKDIIKQCLSDFQNVEHRLEFVASIHGVDYINDSKATNINSTWYALESIQDRSIIWIAGGQDKGNDYSVLEPMVRKKVRAIICLGKDNRKIKGYFADMVESIQETKSAVDAVRAAYHMARRGEVVLLSPACASFDLFANFEDRGNQFKSAVKGL